MKIPVWFSPKEQSCSLGRHTWTVARLIELSRDLPIMDISLDHLNVYYSYEKLTLRDMVMHMNAIMAADLTKPIILDEDGELMDGRHRIMKALFIGDKTIKSVRFEENPRPDEVRE